MLEKTFESALAAAKRIDAAGPLPTLPQALNIALASEYQARAHYLQMAQDYPPFKNVSQIINTQIAELLFLCEKYNVTPITDKGLILENSSASPLENCEIAIAKELEKIKTYEHLFPFIPIPEILDAFYRFQAASYNTFLPMFRECVRAFYIQSQEQTQASPISQDHQHTKKSIPIPYENLLDSIKDILDNKHSSHIIDSMLKSMGKEFLFGSAAGAIAISLLNNGNLARLFGHKKEGE